MILPPAVRTTGFVCSASSLRPFHCVDCLATIRNDNSIASAGDVPLYGRALAPLPFLFNQSLLTVVGPVELWATRERRPSAAANPQGFLGRLSRIAEVFLRAIADHAGLARRWAQLRVG